MTWADYLRVYKQVQEQLLDCAKRGLWQIFLARLLEFEALKKSMPDYIDTRERPLLPTQKEVLTPELRQHLLDINLIKNGWADSDYFKYILKAMGGHLKYSDEIHTSQIANMIYALWALEFTSLALIETLLVRWETEEEIAESKIQLIKITLQAGMLIKNNQNPDGSINIEDLALELTNAQAEGIYRTWPAVDSEEIHSTTASTSRAIGSHLADNSSGDEEESSLTSQFYPPLKTRSA